MYKNCWEALLKAARQRPSKIVRSHVYIFLKLCNKPDTVAKVPHFKTAIFGFLRLLKYSYGRVPGTVYTKSLRLLDSTGFADFRRTIQDICTPPAYGSIFRCTYTIVLLGAKRLYGTLNVYGAILKLRFRFLNAY